jgi:hypothetical protein
MFRKLLRYLMRRAIAREISIERRECYLLGCSDGHSRGHADARSEIEVEIGKSYLAGITDGVCLSNLEPGSMPQMPNKPEHALVTMRLFFDAIDNGERQRMAKR